jgi:glycosyltransferase 2 family protein
MEHRNPEAGWDYRAVTGGVATTTSARGVQVIERRLPQRVRRPADLVRLLVGICLLAITLILGNIATGTSNGLEQDLVRTGTASGLGRLALLVPATVAGIALLALPVALALDLIARRRLWQLLDAVIASAVAAGLAVAFRYWIVHAQPGHLLEALTKTISDGHRTDPVQTLLCAITAFVVLAQIGGRRPWQIATGLVLLSSSILGVLSSPPRVTALSTFVSLLLGWTVGLAVRWVIGAGSTRPGGAHVADTLLSMGIPLLRMERIYDDSDEPRRYVGFLNDRRLIQINVLDRDTYGSAVLARLWRRIRLRGPAARRSFLTVRSAIDHEALMAVAVRDAGVCTPRLVAAAEVGPYAALVAFENIEGVTLDRLTEDAAVGADGVDAVIPDSVLDQIWTSVARLQRRKIVHRGLTADHILCAADHSVALLEPSSGEIAATDLALRLDVVLCLVTIASLVGTERAVSGAVRALGADPVLNALPLMQSIALPRSTRQQLRQHKGLLHDLRARIIQISPGGGGEIEEIRLERLSGRTIIAVVGGTVAVYFILSQLTKIHVSTLAGLNWAWAFVVVVCSTLSFLGAGMTCVGFVIQKVNLFRATLVQYAVGFTGLMAPSAVGTVALNVRFLQRSGVDPAVAVSSVGVVQLVMLVGHICFLVVFSVLAGTLSQTSFTPPAGAVIAVIAVVMVAVIALSLPVGRRLLQARVRPLLGRVLPQLIAVFQTPSKLSVGIGGAILLNLAYIGALYAALRAFDIDMAVAKVAIVYLAGSVVGAAIPTPGGIGSIEAAMIAGLSTFHVPASLAVSAVLLYRLGTFWIPIPVGWWSFHYLTRKGSL